MRTYEQLSAAVEAGSSGDIMSIDASLFLLTTARKEVPENRELTPQQKAELAGKIVYGIERLAEYVRCKAA